MNDIQFPGGKDPREAVRQSQERPQLNISPTQLLSQPTLECEECGGVSFTQAVLLKKLSAIISPNGEEGVFPIQTLACVKCGTIHPELMPRVPGEDSGPNRVVSTPPSE